MSPLLPAAIDVGPCVGKVGYASAASALRGLKRMKRTRKFKAHGGERLNAYRCGHCKFWHLGNSLVKGGLS